MSSAAKQTLHEDRLIVITGATRGLGRAMVEGFATLGHTIVGCGRSAENVADLSRRFPPPHAFAVVDVADDAAVAAWARSTLEKCGPPDLLINNAATMCDPAPLWQVPATEFDAILRVNIGGLANVVRHFIPAMVERQRGIIVNFSSGWGRTTAPEVAPYCATKFAVEGLTKALAQELPRGMAAVALNPGVIDTDMLRQCWADGASAYPTADRWAKAAVPFILGLEPKHNGQSVTVRGYS